MGLRGGKRPREVSALVYPNVIDQHGLREDRGTVGIARPASADRDVQQNEEFVMVDPFRSFREICRRARGVELIVDVEADGFVFPFDRVNVEVVGEGRVAGKAEGCTDALAAGVFRTVNRAVDERRFLADIFHDVDLAALRPSALTDVVAEHPESGPDALTAGNLNAGFEASVFARELAQ